MKEIDFSFAKEEEGARIKALLKQCKLPDEDVSIHLNNFIIAKVGEEIIGIVGLEAYDETGLLRSFAVTERFRGKGLGTALYERIVAHAHLVGINSFYLLTTTATVFFERSGFKVVERERVPEVIRGSREFAEFCPETATCMVKAIE